ncbi:hypothetical protein JYU16_01590, partial [bacterium AH-315-M05]|nr:hypothetical protein [bacterium AH-315-M05]
ESLELLLKDISKPVDHLLLTHAHAANNQKQDAKKHLQTIQNNEHPKIHLGVVRLSERYNLNGIEKTGKSSKELDKEIFEIEFDLVQSF